MTESSGETATTAQGGTAQGGAALGGTAQDETAPKVVALLPAWNAEKFIQRTLDSVTAQTWPNLEIVASVDLSTDRTAEIIAAHAEQDPRFRVIVQPERLGWVGNVNALIGAAANAGADYFVFAFHDDVLYPDYISACVERLEARPQAVLAFSDIKTTFKDGRTVANFFDGLDGLRTPLSRARVMVRSKGQWAVPNRGVFRSYAAARVGGMKRHRGGEVAADWPWLLSLSLLGDFERIPETLVHKYFERDSLSRTWKYTPAQLYGTCEQCAREIMAAPIDGATKTILLGELAIKSAKFIGWSAIHHARKRLRGP